MVFIFAPFKRDCMTNVNLLNLLLWFAQLIIKIWNMQINQYQALIIKCDYVSAVCDSILSNLQAEFPLVGSASLHSYDFGQEFSARQNSLDIRKSQLSQQEKQKVLDSMISSQKVNLRQLQKDIFLITSDRRYHQVHKTKKQTKNRRYIQDQLLKEKQLLNSQMNTLNSINQNNADMNYRMEKLIHKQTKIKESIENMISLEKDHFRFRQEQKQYESLVAQKKKIWELSLRDKQKHEHLAQCKISAITKSIENAKEIDFYLNQLKAEIQESKFIIDQIVGRQKQLISQQKLDTLGQTDEFAEEIKDLRKTVYKYTKERKSRNLINPNKLSSNKNQSKPLFKIECQPISHKRLSVDKVKPMTIKKIVTQPVCSTPKKDDLDSLEVSILQKLIQKKQDQFQKAISQTESLNASFLSRSKRNSNGHIYIEQKDIVIPRFSQLSKKPKKPISQIMGTQQSGIMQKLKNNVRFRTTRSQQEKIDKLQILKKRQRNRTTIKNKSYMSSPSKSQKRIISQKQTIEDSSPKKQQSQMKLETQSSLKSNQMDNFSNDFMSEKATSSEQSIKPSIKLRYSSRVQSFEKKKQNSIQALRQRISSIKAQQSNKQTISLTERKIQHPVKESQNIEIIKLSNGRKSGHSLAEKRKGQAEQYEEDQYSKCDQLSQIDEEDQFLKVTNQTISQR